MSEVKKNSADFIGYEYKEIDVRGEYASLCLDCYPSFGWVPDERLQEDGQSVGKAIVLKRERKIVNKAELTRLQRHFEACVDELRALERSRTTSATIWALVVGLIGAAFLAGVTFAAVHEPPRYVLCILLAVPGFLGWALPYFIYQKLVAKRTKTVAELAERKYGEISEICDREISCSFERDSSEKIRRESF